jgi:hypothetical protein
MPRKKSPVTRPGIDPGTLMIVVVVVIIIIMIIIIIPNIHKVLKSLGLRVGGKKV